MSGYPENFKIGARKFDIGGRPNPILLPILNDALKHILKFKVNKISKMCENLCQKLKNGLIEMGFQLWVHK